MPLRAVLLCVLATVPLPALAQDTLSTVRGRLQDPTAPAAVSSAQVTLTSLADTTRVHRTTARDDGAFELKGVLPGRYRLVASRLGYVTLRTEIRVSGREQDLGVQAMTPESVPMSGVTVSESPPPATQRGDTTEYRAGAVKTHRDATAEDLVQKLPGVTMEGGQIRAQGEQVRQVLVNGRPFFGSDPTAAMRNLPAEVVDRIQVYDRGSDLAEFSGFDDGQSQRTMNFILRDQKAQFGRAYAGYGDQDRYQAGGNATLVRGPTRLTAIGMSNNINQRNFSPQDLFGSMGGGGGGPGGPRTLMFGGPGGQRGGGQQVMRFGGGGAFDPSSFLVNPQSGISTTHSGGLNYTGQWTPRLSLTSSLFVNDTDTDNAQTLAREFLPPQDSIAFYDQRSISDSRSGNQRLDARLEWTPDSLNSLILQPRLYYQNTRARTLGDAANLTARGAPLSAAVSDGYERNVGDNLSSRLTMRHRFGKRGRNVSTELNGGSTRRDGDGTQRSETVYHDGTTTTGDTLDQVSTSAILTHSFSTRVAFTEPLGRGVQLQAVYNPSLSRSESDARAHRFDPSTGGYTRPDSALSNVYESRSTSHNGGLTALYSRGPWRLLTGVAYQHTRLRSEQAFPATLEIDRSFDDVLPAVTLTGSFANRRNLRLAWRTSTNVPSIGQLQNVVNNSNPLSLSTGNPALEPTYDHNLSVRFSEADPSRSRSRFVFLNVTRTRSPIANETFTAPADTTVHGVFLARGTQLTRPVNLDAAWSANLFGVYSRPLPVLKSILSLNGGGTFSRTPTRINDRINRASSYALRSGIVLSSNVSENLDFTVSYWSTYTLARNTLTTSRSGDYFSHNAALRFNAVVGPGIVFRQELSHVLQAGVPSAYGQDVVLMNTTLGKKLLKDNRGEIRLTATDVLEQNRSVSRSVTETYVQDSRDRTLGRYLQAVFSYSFGGAPAGGGQQHRIEMVR